MAAINSLSGIYNPKARPFPFRTSLQPDGAAGRRKTQGVIQQDQQNLSQAGGICKNLPGARFHDKGDVSVCGKLLHLAGVPVSFALHEFISILGLGFTLFHALILMGDRYIGYSKRAFAGACSVPKQL
jgi:hypothetical protein